MNDLHIQLSKAEATHLLWLINRAVNSLEPIKWPPLTQELLNKLEDFTKDEDGNDQP